MSQGSKKETASVAEEPAEAASVADVRVECIEHVCHTSRGRLIKGRRLDLPADEAELLAMDGLVELV